MSTDVLAIKGEEKEACLNSLEYAVKKLGEKCAEIGYARVAEYCLQIATTLKFFHYKRSPTQKFGIKEFDEIIIDPSLSGFPNSEWIRKLLAHKELSEEYLGRMPKEEKIIREAQITLLRGQMPTQQQEQLTLLNYYKSLSSAQLAERRETTIEAVSQSEEGKIYEINSKGLDLTKNLHILYAIKLVQEEGDQKEDAQIQQFFDNSCFAWNPREVFLKLNSLERIRPQSVERFVIGPFYFEKTENANRLQAAFEKAQQPWLLRFRREHVQSKKTITLTEGTFFKKEVKKELCSEEEREQYALCPPSLERALQELFIQEDEEYKIITII